MNKIWSKSNSKTLNSLVEKYTVGKDYLLDLELLPYDIKASIAHAKGLFRIGILSQIEVDKLIKTLKKLTTQKIEITPKDEDCHTVIENYLIQELGEIGKKIHTGRSRNDQVLVAIRLWMKDKSQQIQALAEQVQAKLKSMSKEYAEIPMPGYTHTQQAMLSSVGHYLDSFLESIQDDTRFLKLITKHLDQSPLGSAAGFGVSFNLDREGVAKELGFQKVQKNSLYCQNSRGKFESIYLESLTQIMMTLGKLAGDFLQWTSREFDFFQVDETLVTGSSIMPQKKNLDLLEILRANVAVVMSNQILIKEISTGLLSGYNRDLQLLKKPLFESSEILLASLAIMLIFLNGITPKEEQLKKTIKKDIFAADLANQLVKEKGMNFREAYQIAMSKIADSNFDLLSNLKSKISLGGPGNFGDGA